MSDLNSYCETNVRLGLSSSISEYLRSVVRQLVKSAQIQFRLERKVVIMQSETFFIPVLSSHIADSSQIVFHEILSLASPIVSSLQALSTPNCVMVGDGSIFLEIKCKNFDTLASYLLGNIPNSSCNFDLDRQVGFLKIGQFTGLIDSDYFLKWLKFEFSNNIPHFALSFEHLEVIRKCGNSHSTEYIYANKPNIVPSSSSDLDNRRYSNSSRPMSFRLSRVSNYDEGSKMNSPDNTQDFRNFGSSSLTRISSIQSNPMSNYSISSSNYSGPDQDKRYHSMSFHPPPLGGPAAMMSKNRPHSLNIDRSQSYRNLFGKTIVESPRQFSNQEDSSVLRVPPSNNQNSFESIFAAIPLRSKGIFNPSSDYRPRSEEIERERILAERNRSHSYAEGVNYSAMLQSHSDPPVWICDICKSVNNDLALNCISCNVLRGSHNSFRGSLLDRNSTYLEPKGNGDLKLESILENMPGTISGDEIRSNRNIDSCHNSPSENQFVGSSLFSSDHGNNLFDSRGYCYESDASNSLNMIDNGDSSCLPQLQDLHETCHNTIDSENFEQGFRGESWNSISPTTKERRALVTQDKVQSDVRDGDWMCSYCQGHNFASKIACFTCHRPRPGFESGISEDQIASLNIGRLGGTSIEVKPGDWKCPRCGEIVFAKRNRCYRCSMAKNQR